MTLEGQYKLYLEEHPESKFTFEEWGEWLGKKLTKAFEKYEQSTNDSNTVQE